MKIYFAVIICLTPLAALSQDVVRIRVVDVPRDAARLLGTRITLTDCNLIDATATQVSCIPGLANPNGPAVVLSTKNMPNESFDRLLRNCAPSAPKRLEECSASATGSLDKVLGAWRLSDVSISWADRSE